jgi:cytidylate kinase
MFLLVQGCMAVVLVGAGAGTVMYVRGDLEAVLSNDIDSVYQAAQKSLEQLELKVSSKVKDALAAKIVARDAQDKKITIKLNSTAENTTELNIRIGLFGDEVKSRLIYEQIQKNLNK